MALDGFIGPSREDAEEYTRLGCWLNITLADVLDKAAELHPDKEALVDDRSRLTYLQLKDCVDGLALGLAGLGIGRGDSVMLQLPNWSEFVCSFFAVQKVGATAVLLLPRHMQIEVNHFAGLTKAKAWIVPERYHSTEFAPLTKDVLSAHPHIEHVVSVRAAQGAGSLRLEALMEAGRRQKGTKSLFAERRPAPNVAAFILGTGGTTGLPKAVPRTHNSAVCEAKWKAQAREQGDDAACLLSTPLEHALALAALNSTIFSYGKVVLLDSTRPEDFCAAVERERVTCAPLVPALLSRLVEFDGLERYDMSSLRALYVGGAKTPPEAILGLHRRVGKVYVGAFGMSEGPTTTTRLDDDLDVILNSVGRPCCPYDEFKVVDASGEDLPRNAEGELLAKGPGVFTGYLQDPEENRSAFTSQGYFRTGDLAVIDAAGNVRITGRIKDIILRGGENISPAEIEALIRRHPAVEDVAVVGMPDKALGERACAYIQTRGSVKLTLQEVVSFLRSQGASVLQLPERVEMLDAMPLTKIGKPDKKALREDIRKRLSGA